MVPPAGFELMQIPVIIVECTVFMVEILQMIA
ncbi:hypothetical protein PM8797T_26525 [Gimesia maris DSM 8797]|nr:hypothetical protein PM8797T_26525 [Gimesia maris DSM 8797]